MKKGFTLIEMMVVIVIIGIVIALAVPNFAGMQTKARMKAGAYEVAQDLRQIRERALSISRDYAVDRADARTYIVTSPEGNTYTYKLGGTTGGNLRFGATGATSTPPEGHGSIPGNGFDFLPSGTLVFNARGGANSGVIYITDGKNNYAIGINSLGKIRVYRYDPGSNSWH